MKRRAVFAGLALAAVVSCAPAVATAPTTSPSPSSSGSPILSPTASPTPVPRISSTDRVTIRRSTPGYANGQSTKLVELPVGGGGPLVQIPDGVLLPDKVTVLTLDRGSNGDQIISAVDRRTGKTVGSRVLASSSSSSSWSFASAMSGPGVLSGNGKWLALVGSHFNATDASGAWYTHSEFAVVDTLLAAPPRAVKLDCNCGLDAISDDGRSLYLVEYRPADHPTGSTLRIYDMNSHVLTDPRGDAMPHNNGFVEGVSGGSVNIGSASYRFSFGDPPSVVRLDLNERTVRVAPLPAPPPAPSNLPSNVPAGELSMLWSWVATRDGHSLFLVNGALGGAYEIDAATLAVRRAANLSASLSGQASSVADPSLVARLLRWVAPVADAKMLVHAGAVLSPDERTLYAVAADGIRALDTSTFEWRTFVPQGMFMDLALSSDGTRLYALSSPLNSQRAGMSAFDADSGELLGRLDIDGYPQAIVAVDPG